MRGTNNEALQLDSGNSGSVLGELGELPGAKEHHQKLNRASERLDIAERRERELRERQKVVQEEVKRGWEDWKLSILGALAMIKRLRPDIYQRLPRISGYEQKDLMFISDEIAIYLANFPDFRAIGDGLNAGRDYYFEKIREEEQLRIDRAYNIKEQKVARSDLVAVNQEAKTFVIKNVDLDSPLLSRIKRKSGRAGAPKRKPATVKPPETPSPPGSTDAANSDTVPGADAPSAPAPVVNPAA